MRSFPEPCEPVSSTAGDVYFVARALGGFGGGARAAIDIVWTLLTLGHAVTVVSPDAYHPPEGVDAAAVGEPRQVSLPQPLRLPRSGGRGVRGVASDLKELVLTGVGNVRSARRLKVVSVARPPALVIHNGFPHPRSRYLALIDERGTAPHLMVVHSSVAAVPSFATHTPGLDVGDLAQKMAESAALVFASDQIREEWLALLPETPPLVRTIPPGCRDEQLAAVRAQPRADVRQRLGYPVDAYVIVSVGKVHPLKGQQHIVAALPAILASVPRALLVLVGPRTQESQGLDEEVRRLGLTDHVRFTGPSHVAAEHIYAADLLAHASLAEGLPLVIQEAMALGTPIVASQAGGTPELVIDGKTGLSFAVGDRDAMIAKVLSAVHDAPGARARARAAEAHFAASYSRPAIRRSYRELLSELGVVGAA